MIQVRLIFAVYILVACAGALLYRTSYAVDELHGQLSKLNHDIIAEQENIQVLGAEWTYLSEPRRIEQLAAKYLKMEATATKRVAAVHDMDRLIGSTAAPAAVASAAPVHAAAPVAVAAAAPVVAAAKPVQVAMETPKAQPVIAQAKPAVHTLAAYQPAKTTPQRVQMLLASFQPGKVLTRE